jgi:hypothetical protein
MTIQITVASNIYREDLEKLEYPYFEDVRHDFYKVKGLPGPALTWSEYAQFFNSFPLDKDIETYGLVHYRCALNFESDQTAMKYAERDEFFKRQPEHFEDYKNKIIIGNKLQLGITAWEQYCSPSEHAANIPIMEKACEKFYEITSYDAKQHLQSVDYLYSRNIFISPVNFASRWYKIALEIATYMNLLDSPHKTNDRWGAFILERLFSVYISFEREYEIVERPLVFFTD